MLSPSKQNDTIERYRKGDPMLEKSMEEKLEKAASFNGIDVFLLPAEKFKTNTINIFFHDNLSRDSAARNALVPAVLRRGCESFPTFQEIALYLEELYGASFDCGIVKKGERQILHFYMEHAADRYTGQDENLFEKAFDLLIEIITRPVLAQGAFKSEYVQQEKENLRKLIESRVNDKMQYAVDKCLEEMCREEPFGVYEYGAVEDLDRIQPGDLYEHYVRLLETLPVSVFITGSVEKRNIDRVIDRLYQLKRGNVKKVDISSVEKEVREVRNVTDSMNVNQGKLSLGFRTNTSSNDRDYFSLVVYNGILGGGVHSKLFQNVREKAGLAYYAASRLEKFKGLMVVYSGIEIVNKDKALEIILKQVEEIKAGNISDYEFESTRKTIESGIKSLKDSQLYMVDFYLSQIVVNMNDTLDTVIEKVKNVTRQDVVNIAAKIKLDTVYFLTGKQ
jgi:predicted Zn-dependent peptidase